MKVKDAKKIISNIRKMCVKQEYDGASEISIEHVADVMFMVSSIPGVKKGNHRENAYHLPESPFFIVKIGCTHNRSGWSIDLDELYNVLTGVYTRNPSPKEKNDDKY